MQVNYRRIVEVAHWIGSNMAEQIIGAEKSLTGFKSLLVIIVLTSCCLLGFASRLFAVIRFESIIHEFDPW